MLDSRQHILRLQSLSSGTATLTHVFSAVDTTTDATNVPLSVTTGASTTVFTDTKLGTTNTYLGRVVEFISCTNTALNGLRRTITGYVVSTSTATFTEALPANMTAADTYKIISPMTRNCSGVSIASLAAYNATGNMGSNNAGSVKIKNDKGQEWGCSLIAGTPVSQYACASLGNPTRILSQGGNITVTVVNGTWTAATDFYITLISS